MESNTKMNREIYTQNKWKGSQNGTLYEIKQESILKKILKDPEKYIKMAAAILFTIVFIVLVIKVIGVVLK